MAAHATLPGDSVQLSRLQQVSPDLGDDYMTLELLAVGLAGIQANQQKALWSTAQPSGDPTGFPPAWKAGVTRLLWRALEAGCHELVSYADAFRWCCMPLGKWPLALSVAPSDSELRLIENGRPSAFTEQAARLLLSKDPEAELIENRCYELMIASADRNGETEQAVQDNYVQLRGFLTTRAVASDIDLLGLLRAFPAKDANGQPWVKRWFSQCYRAQPASGAVTLSFCDGCENPVPGQRDCGTPGCMGALTTRTVELMSEYFVQNRAVRRFFHDPGLAEQRMFAALEPEFGQRLHPWWGMDAVDVAIDFDGTGKMGVGEWWAADVKDHASATLLGRSFRWNPRAASQRRVLVIAQHRFEQPDYVDDLTTSLEGRAQGVEIMGEDAFVAAALAHDGRRRR
ncbi:restriction endonuclease-related protein [Streptomyces chrestomyceticus]|uniref:restriction endonuclease-related protein n=1 Tax=Streptomyces chrestomyceticus TaxID=68185 RepID=UPI0035A97E15